MHRESPKRRPPRRLLLAMILACLCPAAKAGPGPDLASVPADLQVPEVTGLPPAAGKRVRLQLFEGTPPVILYLPSDWSPERKLPVIVELPGNGNFKNGFGDTCSGLPEGCQLGYGLSGGRGFVWACLPFLNDAGDRAALTWWGDAPAHRPDSTAAFIKRAVPALCERFSGDPRRVVLCGFSRGAIAVNAIGLHDDGIAGLWRAFLCFSHYDGVRENWPFLGSDRPSALERLSRLKGRPQWICHESTGGESGLTATRRYLEASGIRGDFTFLESGFRNHSDSWLLRPSTARNAAREWLSRVLADPPDP